MAAIFCLRRSASSLVPRTSALTALEAASAAAATTVAVQGWQRDTPEIVLRLWLGPVGEARAGHQLELTLFHRFFEGPEFRLLPHVEDLIEGVVSFPDFGGGAGVPFVERLEPLFELRFVGRL